MVVGELEAFVSVHPDRSDYGYSYSHYEALSFICQIGLNELGAD